MAGGGVTAIGGTRAFLLAQTKGGQVIPVEIINQRAAQHGGRNSQESSAFHRCFVPGSGCTTVFFKNSLSVNWVLSPGFLPGAGNSLAARGLSHL